MAPTPEPTPGLRVEMSPPPAEGPFALEIDVKNPAGESVVDCQGKVLTYGGGSSLWRNSDNGALRFKLHDLPPGLWSRSTKTPRFEMIVRAKGYAPAVVTMDRPKRGSKIARTMTLHEGRRVEMTLRVADGRAGSETLTPLIYLPDHQRHVGTMRQPFNRHIPFDFTLFFLEKLGPGRFAFRAAPDSPDLYVSIHEPGLLLAYDAGPFGSDDLADGRIDIELPKPATLTVTFGPPASLKGEVPYASCRIDVMRFVTPGESSMYGVLREPADGPACRLVARDLAPGEYAVYIRTTPRDQDGAPGPGVPNPGVYSDVKYIALGPGDNKSVAFEFHPLDPDAFRGEHSATLKLLERDGRPAAGKSFKIRYSVSNYGRMTVLEGTVPEDGPGPAGERGRRPASGRSAFPGAEILAALLTRTGRGVDQQFRSARGGERPSPGTAASPRGRRPRSRHHAGRCILRTEGAAVGLQGPRRLRRILGDLVWALSVAHGKAERHRLASHARLGRQGRRAAGQSR